MPVEANSNTIVPRATPPARSLAFTGLARMAAPLSRSPTVARPGFVLPTGEGVVQGPNLTLAVSAGAREMGCQRSTWGKCIRTISPKRRGVKGHGKGAGSLPTVPTDQGFALRQKPQVPYQSRNF